MVELETLPIVLHKDETLPIVLHMDETLPSVLYEDETPVCSRWTRPAPV